MLAGFITWKITSQKPCGFGGICGRKRKTYASLHLHEQWQSCFPFVWLERDPFFLVTFTSRRIFLYNAEWSRCSQCLATSLFAPKKIV